MFGRPNSLLRSRKINDMSLYVTLYTSARSTNVFLPGLLLAAQLSSALTQGPLRKQLGIVP